LNHLFNHIHLLDIYKLFNSFHKCYAGAQAELSHHSCAPRGNARALHEARFCSSSTRWEGSLC